MHFQQQEEEKFSKGNYNPISYNQDAQKFLQQEQLNRQKQKEKEEQESQELIRKLLEQEQEDARLVAEQRDMVMNEEEVCPICLTDLFTKGENVASFDKCGHCFHKGCLFQYIKSQIDEKKIPIKCPQQDCPYVLSALDVQDNVGIDYQDKYDKFAFDSYIDMNMEEVILGQIIIYDRFHDVQHLDGYYIYFNKINCSSYAFFFENEYDFKCPMCMKRYCLKCRAPYHEGQSCAEYRINNQFDENDKKMLDFVKGNKFKQCDKCKFWLFIN